MISKYRLEIKWAAIFVLMMFMWMLLERSLGFHDQHIDKHAIVTNLVALPAIVIYYFALTDKRKSFFGGTMSYKQGVVTGLIITFFVTIVSPLTQYITSELITPNYFKNAINYSVKIGRTTQEQAERFFNLKSFILYTISFTPLMGILTSLIIAFFTKRKKK